MPSIYTEIQINASLQAVWQELMDFDSYAEWNPMVQFNGGIPQVGNRLDLLLKQPSGGKFAVKSLVTERIENRKFQWLGKFFVRGLFDGRHTYELSEQDGGVRFKHYEEFGGILKHPMAWFGVIEKTIPGFVLMNEKLKVRVEQSEADTVTNTENSSG